MVNRIVNRPRPERGSQKRRQNRQTDQDDFAISHKIRKYVGVGRHSAEQPSPNEKIFLFALVFFNFCFAMFHREIVAADVRRKVLSLPDFVSPVIFAMAIFASSVIFTFW